jgi:hypothetical protein
MSSTARIRLRRDVAANWTAANPTLLNGEVGVETDSRRFKIGDGTTAWNSLSYYLNGVSARGQASKTTDGTVTSLTQGVYKSTGLTAILDSSTAFGMSLGTTDLFALKNTSGLTQLMRFYVCIDAYTSSGQTLGIKLAKNGTAIDQTESRSGVNLNAVGSLLLEDATTTGTGTPEVSLVTTWIISMAANDEVSLLIANHDGTENITFKRGRIIATEIDS